MPACSGQQTPLDNKYSKYFSLKNGNLFFEAPFSGLLNDNANIRQAELKEGDFLRFPQTEEAGEIIKIIEITAKSALLEYSRYSAPPAPNTLESYQFKIYTSSK
jgi:hypothetical protein